MTNPTRVTIRCADCGKTSRISVDASPECPKCHNIDIEIVEAK
jgi:Zn finger protein HypA/HybF involved in hydrogenase expression